MSHYLQLTLLQTLKREENPNEMIVFLHFFRAILDLKYHKVKWILNTSVKLQFIQFVPNTMF